MNAPPWRPVEEDEMDPEPEIKEIASEPTPEGDVEGHNFGPAVIGTIAAMQRGRDRFPEKRSQEEPLAPLTKPFPRMRDDRK
jgi:hypothetical protein